MKKATLRTISQTTQPQHPSSHGFALEGVKPRSRDAEKPRSREATKQPRRPPDRLLLNHLPPGHDPDSTAEKSPRPGGDGVDDRSIDGTEEVYILKNHRGRCRRQLQPQHQRACPGLKSGWGTPRAWRSAG